MRRGNRLGNLQSYKTNTDIMKPERRLGEQVECNGVCIALGKRVNPSYWNSTNWPVTKTTSPLYDFIETHYLNEQAKSIKELGDYITKLYKMGIWNLALQSSSLTSTL